jgi:plasmid stabilization system protein ParE
VSRYRVVITAAAEAQLRRALAWWRDHRGDAPDLLRLEVGQVLMRLATQPSAGSAYPVETPSGVRRVLLRRSRYHVYYTFRPSAAEVVVRAIWHSARGSGPPVRR